MESSNRSNLQISGMRAIDLTGEIRSIQQRSEQEGDSASVG